MDEAARMRKDESAGAWTKLRTDDAAREKMRMDEARPRTNTIRSRNDEDEATED